MKDVFSNDDGPGTGQSVSFPIGSPNLDPDIDNLEIEVSLVVRRRAGEQRWTLLRGSYGREVTGQILEALLRNGSR